MTDEDRKPIPTDDPYEILRVFRDESFILVPSSDNIDRRGRCNELIQAVEECLDAYDRRRYATASSPALAYMLQTDPNKLVLEEAVRRLQGDS